MVAVKVGFVVQHTHTQFCWIDADQLGKFQDRDCSTEAQVTVCTVRHVQYNFTQAWGSLVQCAR